MKFIVNTPYANKIKVVDHRDIFSGYEQYLPTFNSRAITTLLWRIPGLAENFLFLNDDFVLIQPTQPEFFFQEDKVVIRGGWQAFTENRFDKKVMKMVRALLGASAVNKRASYTAGLQLSAKILGFEKKYYSLPHNPHAWKKSLLEEFYAHHSPLLQANIHYKLRSSEQFVGEGLMAHLAIRKKKVVFDSHYKTLQLKPGEQTFSRLKKKLMTSDIDKNYVFACVQTLEKAPQESQQIIFEWLNRRVGQLEQLIADRAITF